MSNVKIKGNASGTGNLTIEAPNTNTDRTITLPDGSGELIQADSSGNVGIGTSSPSSNLHINNSSGDATARISAGSGSSWLTMLNTSAAYIHNASNTPTVLTTNGTERMRIDSSGRVTMPYQPHIFGTPGNGTAGSSGNATQFSTQTSRGLSFSNNRITVPVAGVYLITFQTIMSHDAGSGRKDSAVIINGTNVSNGLNNASDGGNGDYKMRTHTFTRYLNANDYIQFNSSAWYASGNGFSNWQTASVSLLG